MNSAKQWYQIKILAEAIDDIAAIALHHGAAGAEVVSDKSCIISALCSESESKELCSILTQLGAEIVQITLAEKINWAQSCESLWKTVSAGTLTVVPIASLGSIKQSSSDTNVIYVIPGTGFGTGHHATTYACLEMLQHPRVAAVKPKKILDLGCGSGILGIAAAKLYASHVSAVDNDPLALENARDNVTANGLAENIELIEGTLKEVSGPFDLIIANIYAEVLCSVASNLMAKLSKNGIVILSGISNDKLDLVKQSYMHNSSEIVSSKYEAGWCSLLLTCHVA